MFKVIFLLIVSAACENATLTFSYLEREGREDGGPCLCRLWEDQLVP